MSHYGESCAKNSLSHGIVIHNEVAEQFRERGDGVDDTRETPPSEGAVGEDKKGYPGGTSDERHD
jgi:hypothetical protein